MLFVWLALLSSSFRTLNHGHDMPSFVCSSRLVEGGIKNFSLLDPKYLHDCSSNMNAIWKTWGRIWSAVKYTKIHSFIIQAHLFHMWRIGMTLCVGKVWYLFIGITKELTNCVLNAALPPSKPTNFRELLFHLRAIFQPLPRSTSTKYQGNYVKKMHNVRNIYVEKDQHPILIMRYFTLIHPPCSTIIKKHPTGLHDSNTPCSQITSFQNDWWLSV